MEDMIRIESISQIHAVYGYDKPKHPLVTLIDFSKVKIEEAEQYESKKIALGLYTVLLKNRCEATIRYGRKLYDFEDGTLIFMAPGQTYQIENIDNDFRGEGYGLYFHPDLIRRSSLSDKMKDYTFFSYDSSEALHLSEKENDIVTRLFSEIQEEFSINIDTFSHELIVSSIELLLNYCKRFYGRQFITRQNVNKDIIVEFEKFLVSWFDSSLIKEQGMPSVKECANKMCLSPNYLSDLLRKETGKNTMEYIHFYVIERAKDMLLNSNITINEIAFALGFEYPGYFSRLFKKKTGMSPKQYRETA